MAALPSRFDARWRDLASGKISKPWSGLATRLLMTRVLKETKTDPSPENVGKCALEIYSFFEKNQSIATADINAAFG